MRADAVTKASLVLGAILSWPVLSKAMDGAIALDTAAKRIAVAMVLATAGVRLIAHIVTGYIPEPEPPAEEEPNSDVADGVEDAVLVDGERPGLEGS